LVWLANREARLAQEIACDQLAIGALQSRPAEYGAMLVDVASGTQLRCATPLAVGVMASYRTLTRRLKAMKHIPAQSKKHSALAAFLTGLLGAGIIIPWQLVAQEAPAATPAAPQTPAPAPEVSAAPVPPTTPAVYFAEEDENEFTPARPVPSRPSRGSVSNVPPPPPPAAPLETAEEFYWDGRGALNIRRNGSVINVAPGKVPYAHSSVRPAPETSEARDQMLRYKFIFKSGLARLCHLLDQQTPDEPDVNTTVNLVGKLERQLVELSDQTDNRDLKSAGVVIQEQLNELNGAVSEAASEKTSQARAKQLTRARAIVEGLTELVPDIDALSAKPNGNSTVQTRIPSAGGGYGATGGGYGGYGSAGASGVVGRRR
jgi:hypothetical protein